MTALRQTLRTADALVSARLIPESNAENIAAVAQRYAMAITPAIAELIDPADPNDPIARQFVPDIRELHTHAAERTDPIGDRLKSPAPGIVHRYPDRVLFKVASICPVYCRFCFRREMVGPEHGETLSPAEMDAAFDYIRRNAMIWEVILTGGDPFILSERRIRHITETLGRLPHLQILRWHTRVPIADPDRVTDAFVAALSASQKTVFVALHVNHVRELTPAARSAIAKLVDGGIPVVSQTVLLKGVNDEVDTLETLLRALVATRVKPYYLHHGDLAPGTAHFRTSIERGQRLMTELRRRLSGLALPTYVLDIPGAHGKVPLSNAISNAGIGRHLVRDASGQDHIYEDACTASDSP
jgi:lysine 2,3-aminomutase